MLAGQALPMPQPPQPTEVNAWVKTTSQRETLSPRTGKPPAGIHLAQASWARGEPPLLSQGGRFKAHRVTLEGNLGPTRPWAREEGSGQSRCPGLWSV